MNFVLDTNAVIYLQKGLLVEPLPIGQYFLSVISEIELLSFPGLMPDQEAILRELLSDVTVVGIDDDVKHGAIRLRRERHIKLPDAIVLSTAMAMDAELLSNDIGFTGIPGTRVRSLALKQT